jgi:arylformamidase
MTDLIDISLTLRSHMPLWPDTDPLSVVPSMRISKGDEYNVSRIECDLHTGTHVDAPWHGVDDGRTVDQLPLGLLIGPALVAHLPHRSIITSSDLDSLKVPPEMERLLLRTDNSELWRAGINEFRQDYVGVDHGAARWVIRHGIRLLGVDYLSVEPYDEALQVHKLLLSHGVLLLEGVNLMDVEPGVYELVCLPIKLEGADGAPTRAVLRSTTGVVATAPDGGEDA